MIPKSSVKKPSLSVRHPTSSKGVAAGDESDANAVDEVWLDPAFEGALLGISEAGKDGSELDSGALED